MIKTKKIRISFVALFVAICLCIGIGAGLINGNEKGISVVGNGIQSTSSIPEGARPITSLSDFNSWLNMEVSDN